MIESDVLNIYFPYQFIGKSGWVLGWKDSLSLCICCVIEGDHSDKPPSDLYDRVHQLNSAQFPVNYWKSSVKILGYLDLANGSDSSNQTLSLQQFHGGKPIDTSNLITQVIYYNQRKPIYASGLAWEDDNNVINESLFTDFSRTLFQMNSSETVYHNLKSSTIEGCSTFKKKLMMPVAWFIAFILIHVLYIFLPLIRLVYNILQINWKPYHPRDISLFAATLERRLKVMIDLVDTWKYLNQIETSWKTDEFVAKVSLDFYNTLFNVAMDYCLGALLLYIIMTYAYSQHVAMHLAPKITSLWGFDILRKGILWIMEGSPGGLKLSGPAANALGSLFMFYIERWDIIILGLSPLSLHAIWSICLSLVFGVTLSLSLCHDVLYFVNMHIYWLYSASARMYSLILRAVLSLWLLFRGKKRNILKNRIDSCDYTNDQLIFGTLLFASFILLLPTVMMYYLLFLFAMAVSISIRRMFQLLICILNDLPMYSIINYIFRSRTLNGGVYLSLVDPTQEKTIEIKVKGQASESKKKKNKRIMSSSYYKIHSYSVPIKKIFWRLDKSLGAVFQNFTISAIVSTIIKGESATIKENKVR